MPVLPLIDLLILIAWTSLIGATFLKAIALAMARVFTVFGLGPFDFVVISGVSLLFALALAARVWVKANEPRLLRAQRMAAAAPEVLPDFPDPREVPGRGEPLPTSAGAGVRDRAASA